MSDIIYYPAGDKAVLVKFGTEISEQTSIKIRKIINILEEKSMVGILDWVPAYISLLITYNPLILDYQEVVTKLKKIVSKSKIVSSQPGKTVEIPVVYGGRFGPDLEYVAEYNNLKPQEVIDIHSSSKYLVYMIGFSPGFPYLGELAEKIATPRLNSPRQEVLSGSVGIAQQQTGIYPISSPGGWQIIGRSPLSFLELNQEPELLLQAGDYVEFKPIDKSEFSI